MIGFFRKTERLLAPVSGTLIRLEDVPDEAFSQKKVGDGIAIKPDDCVICAPCNATVLVVAKTLHALILKANNGAEILIHIGIDTVNLNGDGFELLTSKKRVACGTPLIRFNRALLEQNEICMTTMMLIANYDEHPITISENDKKVKAGEDTVIEFA